MKYYQRLFAPLLGILIILSACSPTAEQLKIDSTNFDQQVDPAQNLEFNFNHDLVPDSLINSWSSVDYITFQPEIKGRFKWNSHSQLVFSPSEPFAPNTDYKATIQGLIAKISGKNFELVDKEISFHTPYLAVDRNQAYWGISPTGEDVVQLRLKLFFTYPVDVKTLKQYVELRIYDKPVNYETITLTNSAEIEFGIPAPEDERFTGNITITLKKGMKCPGSDRPLPDNLVYFSDVPARDQLSIMDVVAEFEEGEGVIYIYTSQPIKQQNLKVLITVEPKVDFEIIQMGNGLKLKGSFADEQVYDLAISEKLKGIFGPEMGNEFRQQVSFGAMKPYITFSDQSSLYLTPKGSSNLGIKIINVPKVKITVFKVFENNIQHFMRQGRWWNGYYDEDEYFDNYSYQLDDNFGKVIHEREIDTRSLPRKGNIRLLNIRPEELELSSAMKGIYLIKVESTEKSWLNDVQMVSVSDIGLIVRQGVDEIFVAARSILDAQPLSGVRVRFFSANNQQVFESTTDGKGIATFKNIAKTIPGFKIAMITASRENDYNVLLFSRSRVETSRFDVGGKRTANLNYDVYLYGDRNLYRPGDSVFCNALLRTFNWETVSNIPVKFRVIAPDGKDYLNRRAQLNSNGAAQLSFAVSSSALTGKYTIEVLSANDVMLANYRISVEEFMPDRIKVEVKTDKKTYQNSDQMKVEVLANNLFGPPATNRKVENEFRVNRQNFHPKKFNDYNFGITLPQDINFENQVSEGVTDAKGTYSQTISLPEFENMGLLQGLLFTTVFDETGRPVNRYTEVEIATQQKFLGIKNLPGWMSSRKPFNIQLIALDRSEKAISAKAHLDVVSIRYETVLERNYGQTSYRSQRKENIVLSRDINIGPGGYMMEYTPNYSGAYEVRVSLPGSRNYVKNAFYAYYWGDNEFSSFDVNREGEVGIETDKQQYKPGDNARILFKTPFQGELLVTIERDKILEYYSLKADANGATLDLKIRDEFLPNVYVSATLIRQTDQSGLPLTVAHGYASIKVDDPSRELKVIITAPAKSRSKVSQTIKIKTEPNAEVTVALVDEGILQITGFASPDPYHYFYQKRALEVEPYDLFKELFPELGQGSSSGGDRGFDMGKRLNPLTAKRVKLLALWSGTLKANAQGEVDFRVKLPQFSGAARVMAVAYNNNRFGSADAQIKIADPVVISTSLPRFLSPGDEAFIITTLTNTTAKPIAVNLKVNSKGPVTGANITKEQLTIPANGEIRTNFKLTAGNSIGNASVSLAVKTDKETFTWENEIGVRPAATLEKSASAGVLKAGETKKVDIRRGFIPGSSKSTVLLTRSPVGKYAGDLSNLVNYPYGCLEQTISAAFPQLYFDDLSRMLNQTDKNDSRKVGENIREAIQKISAQQQYNGGLVSWPSGGEVNWWNTAYAGHFLYEASKAGYSVNKDVSDKLIRFLTMKVKQKPSTEYFFLDQNNQWVKTAFPNRETFYSLYVLALNGKQHLPTMNYYKARKNTLTNDSRYMLASSYLLLGDANSANTLLENKWENYGTAMQMTGGSYSSPIRDRAIALYSLLSASPDHPQIALLARQVGEMVSAARWMSTQEMVFSMLALGKLAGTIKSEDVTATIDIDGKAMASFTGPDITTKINGDQVTLIAKGKGALYYYVETEGIPASGESRETDKVLKVRRQLFNRNGSPVNNDLLQQNDLVVVEITLSTTDNSTVENCVVTDLLPACFEVENTRLTAEREMEWIKSRTIPEHIDFRDDRVNLFTKATGMPSKFYYMVRVVSKGQFVYGPVGAEAMYNGQYYSYNGKGKLTIK